MAAMYIDVHTAEYIGARDEQQDLAGTARLNDPAGSQLLVLADGVGGQTGGATAAKLAVGALLDAAASGAFDDASSQREKLQAAIDTANSHIHDQIEAEPRLEGMATTLVAAIVSAERVRWVSVGDSHLYLLRGGRLTKLNEDHSYASLLVKTGKRAADDPELDEYRNLIASALSGEEIKYVDLPEDPFPLENGDIVLLASDGIDTLANNHVEALLYEKRNASAGEMAEALLNAVRSADKPHQDNATVIVGRLEGEAATSAGPISTEDGEEVDDAPRTRPAPPRESTPRVAAARPLPGSRPAPARKGAGKLAIVALIAMAVFAGGAYWAIRSIVYGENVIQKIGIQIRDPLNSGRRAPDQSPFQRQLPTQRDGPAPAEPAETPSEGPVRRITPSSYQEAKCMMYFQRRILLEGCEPYLKKWQSEGQ